MKANLGRVVLVKDINLGIEDSANYGFNNSIEFNDRLYFSANDGERGNELWVTDGTRQGTQLLKDIFPGSHDDYHYFASSDPRNLIEFNDRLYFSANDGERGNELWVTDGTRQGTQLVRDIDRDLDENSTVSFYPNNLIEFKGKLYFAASDSEYGEELWVSDGTPEGTQLLKDIAPSTSGSSFSQDSSSPWDFIEFKDKLYFIASDTEHDRELWVSDGTPEGTRLLKDINPGGDNGDASSLPGDFTEFQDKLYFTANDGEHGKELWITDGTTEGTQLLKDINPGSQYHPPSYSCYDGVYEKNSGYYTVNYSSPSSFTEFKDKLYFTASHDLYGSELWVTDGTPEGTQLVKDINLTSYDGTEPAGSSPQNLIEFKDKLYFTANDEEHGNELWVSDGTTEGTKLFKDINPGSGFSSIENFIEFNNLLYFAANDGEHGKELWVTDGTPQGTLLAADINHVESELGYSNSNPTDLTVFGNELFFSANDGENGRELFKLTFDDSTQDFPTINPLDSSVDGEGSDNEREFLDCVDRISHYYNGSVNELSIAHDDRYINWIKDFELAIGEIGLTCADIFDRI